MLSTFSITVNLLVFVLLLRRSWKSVDTLPIFLIFIFFAFGNGVLVMGDIDLLTPDVEMHLAGSPSARSMIARSFYLVGLLVAELVEWRCKMRGKKGD